MELGRMRERVTLKRRTTANSGGAAVVTFATVSPARVQASVESPTGSRLERLFGAQVVPIASHLVMVRAWDEVALGDQVVWHDGGTDRTLEIVGRQDVGPLRRFQVLACEERDVA
jgi:transcription elongation GreA/GreB family factor